MKWFTVVLIGWLGTAQAAQVSVEDGKAEPGSQTVIQVGYLGQGAQATAVQFDLRFAGSQLTIGVEAGEASIEAGKAVSSNAVDADTLRIIVSGVNQTVLGDGPLVLLTLEIAPGAPEGDYGLLLSQASATDQQGQPVDLFAGNGTLTVMTMLPPLLIFPQYAEGAVAGISSRTRLVIRNNSDQEDSGSVRFLDASGACRQVPVGGTLVSSLSFDLPPWSSTEIETDGTSPVLLSGPVTIDSQRGEASGLEATLIFSVLGDRFVSVPSAPPRSRHQIYVSLDSAENTGLALFNPGEGEVTIDLTLLDASGETQAAPLALLVASGEHLAAFLDQPPLFEAFFQQTADFKGTLNLRVRDGGQVSVLGLIQRRDTGALIAVGSSPNAMP